MMILQTLGAATPDLSLPLAAGKALSVKGYSNGWASYQSPAANGVLIDLNMNLRKLGFDAIPIQNGVVTSQTVAAVKLVASVSTMPGYAGIALSSGGTAGFAGGELKRYTTAETIAKNGVSVRYYIKSLAETGSFKPIMEAVAKGQAAKDQAATPPPPPPPPPPSYTPPSYTPPATYVPDPTAASTGVDTDENATGHWPYYVAGGILAVATLFGAMTLVAKKKRSGDSSAGGVSKTKKSGARGKIQRGLVPVGSAFVPNEASVKRVLAVTLLRNQRPSAHQKHLLTAAYMHDKLPREAGGVSVAQWVEDGFPTR